jgi:hypothetical protein
MEVMTSTNIRQHQNIMKKGIVLLLLFAILTSCNKNEELSQNLGGNVNPINTELVFPEELSNSDFNILFIGNSLTYTNDLPDLVKRKAQLKGITVGTKMIAHPNFAIVDHWVIGEVQQYIESKKFDFVIAQQGPSSQQEGRDILIEYGARYKDLCQNNNTGFGYFMVWPSRTYYHTFAGVIKNHQDAAAINDAILCPVGEVWKTHFDTTNNFDYYGPDGFHPSIIGSQIAADVIVDTLFP